MSASIDPLPEVRLGTYMLIAPNSVINRKKPAIFEGFVYVFRNLVRVYCII